MPILLEFKPTKTIKMPNDIEHELISAILRMPSLPHQGTKSAVYCDSDSHLVRIKAEIKGLCVIDEESCNMLLSLVSEQIKDCDLPFYVSSIFRHEKAPTEEALFLHDRFKPLKSKNSKLLAKITGLEIPDELCCPLSGDIMDDPVFDIRSPQVHYDQDFLQYWLRKSAAKLMPHTRLPCNKNFIQTNFALKIKIMKFVQSTLELASFQERKQLLEKFKITDSDTQKCLNQALRRAAMSGENSDIEALFSLGANVNAQDDNPQKRFTALHLAIQHNKIDEAIMLLTAGARIDISDASGRTPADLITERLRARDQAIQPLLLNCEILGLVIPGVVRRRVPSAQSSPTLFATPTRDVQHIDNLSNSPADNPAPR